MTTPVYRVRFVLRAKRDISVPGLQGGLLYALLCNANADQSTEPAFPRDLMLDAPEQGRTLIRRGEAFAFGGSILSNSALQATELVSRLSAGLQRLGGQGQSRTRGLGGNYELVGSEDLIASCQVTDDHVLQQLPLEQINAELQALSERGEVTLRFASPLRIPRWKSGSQKHQTYFDEDYFDPVQFTQGLLGRMRALGLQSHDPEVARQLEQANSKLLENNLVWLDMAYGGREKGKTLGGACGAVRLHIDSFVLMAALVWGQYLRAGKNTAFGFGNYRIEELGPTPYACLRTVPLLETAWNSPNLDRLANKNNLEAGVVSQAIETIRVGDYQPHPTYRLTIGEGDKSRQLDIPSRRDRVLQRSVLDAISPALDELFESSSFAWRKGLSRQNCAKAIAKFAGQGFRVAVHADFDRFFESIPQVMLLEKLRAYLGDDETVELIRKWISPGRSDAVGIPTGAPISPLLGNLMLDRFDERIAAQGGRLVRYGDDFLILFRDEPSAERALQLARQEATELEMQLNDDTLKILDLDEPFQFLGYRFQKTDRWQRVGKDRPMRLDELGWFDASQNKPRLPTRLKLVGETGDIAHDLGTTCIVGPGATHLEVQSKQVHCHYAAGAKVTTAPINEMEWLIVLGSIGVSSASLAQLTEMQTNVVLADDRGQVQASITGDFEHSADAVIAQVHAYDDSARTLQIACELVSAKLHNYACLARELPDGSSLAGRLESAAQRAKLATHLNMLRGVEGSAAGLWYGEFSKFLGKGFEFRQRVAPSAEDAVNVLLNIGFTHLYRLLILSVRAAGLMPSLGFLHSQTGRFQALASDLQEPFRFLIDRSVIEATSRLNPKDFRLTTSGQYALQLQADAAREFQSLMWHNFYLAVQQAGSGEPVSYLVQMQRDPRRLRRFLINPTEPYQAFRLP